MKIEITAEDIKNGVRSNLFRCPLALALSRALGTQAIIHRCIIPDATKPCQWGVTPPEVLEWLRDYDDGFEVLPFSFEMPPLNNLTSEGVK